MVACKLIKSVCIKSSSASSRSTSVKWFFLVKHSNRRVSFTTGPRPCALLFRAASSLYFRYRTTTNYAFFAGHLQLPQAVITGAKLPGACFSWELNKKYFLAGNPTWALKNRVLESFPFTEKTYLIIFCLIFCLVICYYSIIINIILYYINVT